MRTRMKMRTKIGSRFFLAFALTLTPFVTALPAQAGKKEKKPASPAESVSPAILAGTVFSGAGFALRGAEIVVTRVESSSKHRWKAVSDARGEFLLRLPSGPAKYNVSVRASGLKPEEKQVSFEAGERLDQNFLLEPAEGKK